MTFYINIIKKYSVKIQLFNILETSVNRENICNVRKYNSIHMM